MRAVLAYLARQLAYAVVILAAASALFILLDLIVHGRVNW